MNRTVLQMLGACAAWMALVLLLPGAALAGDAEAADAGGGARFLADIEALLESPHRLAGTPEGAAAADHIERRLQAMGLEHTFRLEAPTFQLAVDRGELSDGDQRVPLLPLRPNIHIPPTTGPEGLTGPLIYAGQGRPQDYGERDPDGAIVVLEYDSGSNWRAAMRMGAKAVVFLGDDDVTEIEPKHLGLPANLVRLYAPPEAQAAMDLRRDRDRVTVHSHVRWQRTRASSVIAVIPGTDPVLDITRRRAEALVLSANFDSYGQVPHQSPGARGAANVAALLETAEALIERPPRRHVIIAFLDNQAQQRQGARLLYRSLTTDLSTLERRAAGHREEGRFVDQAIDILEGDDDKPHHWAQRLVDELPDFRSAMRDVADFARADDQQQAMRLRLAEADEQTIEALDDRIAAWDEIRRVMTISRLRNVPEELEHLHDTPRDIPDASRELIPDLIASMPERKLGMLQQRRQELLEQVQLDQTQSQLRRLLGDLFIALHVDYNLSDGSPQWAPIAGDTTRRFIFDTADNVDRPIHYGGVMRAFRRAVEAVEGEGEGQAGDEAEVLTRLDESMLRDATRFDRFASGQYVSNGLIAGLYGINNVSLMTGSDARPRDGHPADTLDRLDWQRLRAQAQQATAVLRKLGSEPALSASARFRDMVTDAPPQWNDRARRMSGNFVSIRVTGGLREDRPVPDAVIAHWPHIEGTWTMHARPAPMNYSHTALTPANARGYFDLLGAPSPGGTPETNVIGTRFDGYGRVDAITNEETLLQEIAGGFRTELIEAHGFAVFYPLLSQTSPESWPLRVLGVVANVPYAEERRLTGEIDNAAFFYLSRRHMEADGTDAVKVFAERGPALLGLDEADDHGAGIPIEQMRTPPPVDFLSMIDKWWLNDHRLRTMRQRNVSNAAMERMHFRAQQDRSHGEAAERHDQKLAAYAAGLQRANRIYQPIRETMNDLVTAVVVLLLLTIPFAFALERLLVGASTIYGRLAGFVTFFLLTFSLLYLMHPGFAVATTPIIIFLAFVIVLLSTLVIYLLLRKFNTELKAIHGQSTAAHAVELSRIGTLVAAANMGMSTMRRRPLRTALTALTVILLTFTILCFATVGTEPGVRAIYLGAADARGDADVLVRQIDYSALEPDVLHVLGDERYNTEAIHPHRWLVRETSPHTILVGRPDNGQKTELNAVIGFDPGEIERWDALREVVDPAGDDPAAALEQGVLLPSVVMERLELEPGDDILLDGHRTKVAGTFDTMALQRLDHIDLDSALPIDYDDPVVQQLLEEQQQMMEEEVVPVQRSFTRLSAGVIALGSNDLLRRLGAEPRVVRLYLSPQAQVDQVGRDLAEVMPSPVWIRGVDGAERLVFTNLLDVRAGEALLVPLLLGGLIVFGTMLGSIADREREIYTFSALGLAPVHVGLLFFAEAAVYAIVGGMGGQLLAQLVAVVAGQMAQVGLIHPPTLNFSSTQSLFAIFVVMLTVLVSAVYPALRASRSANPGLARTWRMPEPKGDRWEMLFPFTVSAYDITGVVSYLAEHFRAHDDAGLGRFAAQEVLIDRGPETGHITLSGHFALAPFDLGVTQRMTLTATPSEIPGVDEVGITIERRSGAYNDWKRTNRVFIQELREQFLLWRTLATETVEQYRLRTLQELGQPEQKGGGEGAAEAMATGERT